MSIETCHSLVLILKYACIILHHITHEWSEWLRSMRFLWKVSRGDSQRWYAAFVFSGMPDITKTYENELLLAEVPLALDR